MERMKLILKKKKNAEKYLSEVLPELDTLIDDYFKNKAGKKRDTKNFYRRLDKMLSG